ncbi:MAG: transcriptional regulator [Rhodovulum sulfidophilum]|uniref:Transcriptional regulator n=1 Tax=Rhodovulum sulfidophilum TaxID=35806 RepID=A0A2W5Q2P3_RHOSU|nr:MAG: transcriptional regulator [Rhodovulum sulfidophilum]
MELRHIRYFLAVAEEGNFTRAAQRLGIGQPPLSTQIRDLEREVGAALFHRVPHGAELTEAGTAFLAEVRGLPNRARGAIEAARRAARGETGTLALGFTGTAALNPVVSASIRAFRRSFPEVVIRVEEASSIELNTRLIERGIDVAILRPSPSDPGEMRVHELLSEPLILALPAAHPAAAEETVALARLCHEPMILTPRSVGVGLHDAAVSACHAAGFTPVLGQAAPYIASILSLVASELGVSLVPSGLREVRVEGVAYRDIRPPVPRVSLALAYRSRNPPRLALNLAALARAVARGRSL